MEITLKNEVFPIRRRMAGDSSFSLAAGKTLKIETTPGGEEVLNQVVPAGKSWQVEISVSITERET